MKKFSKILSVALLVALVLSLGVTSAFAQTIATGKGGDGSITVSNATVGNKYTLYKVFDATVIDGRAAGADGISYTSTWTVPTNDYFGVDDAGNVTYKQSGTELSAAAITWLKSQISNFEKIGETVTAQDPSVVWTGLKPGYYFIETNTNTAVTVTSITPSVTVIDKNQTTTYDKEEQVANGTWVYKGAFDDTITPPSAKVGDVINYRVTGTISHYIGTEQVTLMKFKDVMSDGLTATQDAVVKIKINGTLTDINATVNYSVAQDGKTTTTITFPTVNGNEFLYDNNAEYEITYSATLNEKAIIDGEEENTVDILYNNDTEIGQDKTKVKTYNISLLKVDGNNSETTDDDSALAGAKFKLYAKDGTTVIKVVLVTGDNCGDGTAESTKDNIYRVAKAANETGAIEEMIVGKTGKIVIKGLGNGQYEFEETEAPVGFNKLTARTAVATVENQDAAQITAINNKGTQLPSTGGIGTTIFYAVGGILVLAAIVLLITKKRMSD